MEEKNLFTGAKFGDEFIRRDGKIARYCGLEYGRSSNVVLECDGETSVYTPDGLEIGPGWENDFDIIAQKEE